MIKVREKKKITRLDQEIVVEDDEPIMTKEELKEVREARKKKHEGICTFFCNTFKHLHRLLNLVGKTGRMYPRHTKFNLFMLGLLIQCQMNALFFEVIDKGTGCGQDMPEDENNRGPVMVVLDQLFGRITKKITGIVCATVFSAPFMKQVAVLLKIQPKQKKWVKSSPISFKTQAWKVAERDLQKRWVQGYGLSMFCASLLTFYLWNMGNSEPAPVMAELLIGIFTTFVLDILIWEPRIVFYVTALEAMRRYTDGTKWATLITLFMIALVMSKEGKLLM